MEDIADGKRRLIDAALRLAAARRSFAALGLRELAREAGLNPNTFYRHFRDMEDLAITALAEVSDELRPMLRAVRWPRRATIRRRWPRARARRFSHMRARMPTPS